jgi:hypothetical protein
VAEEGGEVWEDELDSMKARLTDNCASRDKFMDVSLKEAQAKREEEAKAIFGQPSPARQETEAKPAKQ